ERAYGERPVRNDAPRADRPPRPTIERFDGANAERQDRDFPRNDRPPARQERDAAERRPASDFAERGPRFEREPRRDHNDAERAFDDAPRRERPQRNGPEPGMETFRVEVGHTHGVKPGNLVGAIANEADLESRFIGRIDIRDHFTLIDLPEGMPRETMEHLKRVRVAGQQLKIRRDEGAPPRSERGGFDRGDRGDRGGFDRGHRGPRRDR
ncbi:MAG TPA: DbpA RNA binding domain-containing protein, partial [Lysobacter sp.]